MFFGSSVYKEIITAASERLAGFNAFIFPSEIGSAFVAITRTGNWGWGRQYLGSFSVQLLLESMAAQHGMWGCPSTRARMNERRAASSSHQSHLQRGTEGGHQHSAPAAWGCSVCPVGRDPQSPQPSQSPWGLGLQAGHPLLMHTGQAQLHGCRSFCLWESLHAGKINLRDNTGPYCLSQVPTHASLFQEIFSWKQKL